MINNGRQRISMLVGNPFTAKASHDRTPGEKWRHNLQFCQVGVSYSADLSNNTATYNLIDTHLFLYSERALVAL